MGWAVDQFHCCDVGDEPNITGDLNGVGVRRTEVGINAYKAKMDSMLHSLTPDKVCTFLFWGASQFVDLIKWQLNAGPVLKCDVSKWLGGGAPIFVVAYQFLPDAGLEKRHLRSRKKYYFQVVLWSDLKRLDPAIFQPEVPSGEQLSSTNAVGVDRGSGPSRVGTIRTPTREAMLRMLAKSKRICC